MTYSYEYGRVALQVKKDDYDYQTRFIWKGREWKVKKRVESWQIAANWWEAHGEIRRYYHALIALLELDMAKC
jgi:hypothetical protein